jgi:hypothetical protein
VVRGPGKVFRLVSRNNFFLYNKPRLCMLGFGYFFLNYANTVEKIYDESGRKTWCHDLGIGKQFIDMYVLHIVSPKTLQCGVLYRVPPEDTEHKRCIGYNSFMIGTYRKVKPAWH